MDHATDGNENQSELDTSSTLSANNLGAENFEERSSIMGDDRKTTGVILSMNVLCVVHGVCFVQGVVAARKPFLVII